MINLLSREKINKLNGKKTRNMAKNDNNSQCVRPTRNGSRENCLEIHQTHAEKKNEMEHRDFCTRNADKRLSLTDDDACERLYTWQIQ